MPSEVVDVTNLSKGFIFSYFEGDTGLRTNVTEKEESSRSEYSMLKPKSKIFFQLLQAIASLHKATEIADK